MSGPSATESMKDAPVRLEVPFYRQHYDFTCSPASLMMAMKYFDRKLQLTKSLEMDIWREANMVDVYGTSRYGLAFSAAVRWFSARVASNIQGIGFVDKLASVQGINRRRLLFFFKERRMRSRELGVEEEKLPSITLEEVWNTLRSGEVPMLLTSTKLFGEKDDLPHWVVVTGLDRRMIVVNNPLGVHGHTALLLNAIRDYIGYKGDQCLVRIGRPHAVVDG